MKKTLILALLLSAAPAAAETLLPIPNGNFEDGLNGWTKPAGETMSTISTLKAAGGTASLRVQDASTAVGSDLLSTRVAVTGGTVLELRGYSLAASGASLGVYVRFYDAAGAKIGGDSQLSEIRGSDGRWHTFSFAFAPPANAASVAIWLHSYVAATVDAYLDELYLAEAPAQRPWPPEYKIKPQETSRLTPADVPGPDGIVYPNWTKTGVQGGIPTTPVVARIEDFGGAAGDSNDDSAALQAACDAAARAGGGAVSLGAGTYFLDNYVTVSADGVVIRGQGPQTTQVTIRYPGPAPSSGFDKGIITFKGLGATGSKILLSADGKRGDTDLQLQSAAGLSAGDAILIYAPATDRWNALVNNASQMWGDFRMYQARIESVSGNTVRINQPLRITFPTIDGSYVQKFLPVSRCGVEDLALEHANNVWVNTVNFTNAWNCWARNVRVRMCGRMAVYGHNSKWCEIRQCVFDDAWNKGEGGTAYVGWDKTWDCLTESVETFNLRHAPLFQWAASGNVVRKSVFHNSDAQLHAGWANENLIEQCVVESLTKDNGGYGYGFFVTEPGDVQHGPDGPRNVIYNSDFSSLRDGVWLGGMNENYLIVYNRFVVDAGPAVRLKITSFDHIIRGNTVWLKDSASPLLFTGGPDCLGLELVDNDLYGGNGAFWSGAVAPEVITGNRVFPGGMPPRPQPAVPSIYEWQIGRLPAPSTPPAPPRGLRSR